MKSILKLGTRKSLLAMTQSLWVAQEIEKVNPTLKVELVGIETQGDLILDIPLSKIEGKEFFIKELDDALLQKKVDFTVHSLKDLSMDRPPEFFSASIPKRALSNDFLLMHSNAFEKIKKRTTLKIGTSAPRRLENTPYFLENFLLGGHQKNYTFVEIRGNINTRLSRVHLPESDPKHLDAVVLAAAGLIRLSENKESNIELKKLLKNVFISVLPLSVCPPAPGQGALAIECLAEKKEIQKILMSIHHENSEKEIKKERHALQEYGGGCHQRFGASAIEHAQLGPIFIVKGHSHQGEAIDRYEFEKPDIDLRNIQTSEIFDGSQWKAQSTRLPYSLEAIHKSSFLFIAHHRVIGKEKEWDHDLITALKNPSKTIWTSGCESWKKLSAQGISVQGCLENLGISKLEDYIHNAPVLHLPALKEWVILTQKEAKESWSGHHVETPYSSQYILEKNLVEKAKKARLFYWQSPEQFRTLAPHLPKNALHFSGAGKTYQFLKKQNISSLYAFPHSLLWKKWLKEKGVL